MNKFERMIESIKKESLQPVYSAFKKNNPIKVSVNVEVFNHEKYLRECLNSILNQLVNFNVVINIHDDASTDGSKEIIEEYQRKYPDIISPIIQKENIYSKTQKENPVLTIQGLRVKGQYVAMCEGDDYWTDPYKLQIQSTLMDQNPSCRLCLHIVEKINNKTGKLMNLMPSYKMKSGILSSKRFIPLVLNKYSFQTSSYFFKAEDSMTFYSSLPKFADIMPTGDETMIMYYGQLGNVIFINKKMSVYRKFAEGSWSVRHREYSEEKNIEVSKARIKSLLLYDSYTNYKFHKSCQKRMNKVKLSLYLRTNDRNSLIKDKKVIRYFRKKHFIAYIMFRCPKLYKALKRNKNNESA